MTSHGPFDANERPNRSHAARQTSRSRPRDLHEVRWYALLRSQACVPIKSIAAVPGPLEMSEEFESPSSQASPDGLLTGHVTREG